MCTYRKKRWRIAKSDAGNLWEAVGKDETEILRFASGPMASFTHNLSERKIRMSRVEQKVLGCFRSCRYAVAWYRVSSCLYTMSLSGVQDFCLHGKAVHMLNGIDRNPWNALEFPHSGISGCGTRSTAECFQ